MRSSYQLQISESRQLSLNKNSNKNNENNNLKKSKIRYNKKAESEFFVDNSALAGFTGERILYMAVRELIENSLDSCENSQILPNIALELKNIDSENDLWSISCSDNGIGIPEDKVPEAVCSFLTSGKYVEKQQRGLFGVGLKMIAAFSTKDTDIPIKVWSKSHEEQNEFYFELRTDIGTNKPIVLLKKECNSKTSIIKNKHGFKVQAILRARLSPITKNKIYDYVTQTSIVNPYSILNFETDDGKITFERRTNKMPEPAREVLPHPADMDLQTLKKAITNFTNQKTTLQGVLSSAFQKMSAEKAREIINKAAIESKSAEKYDEHELIKVVNVCKHIRFQTPNTDHLSPIGKEIFTTGMTSEYTIVSNKENSSNTNNNNSRQQIQVKIIKPALTAYTNRTCVINNRPTIIECGIAYGGDISGFKLFRFANKIPLLYDEGSDVAREVVSEVEINKMGITKKEVKEQFAVTSPKSDRAIEMLPIHIFFHICSTKIPYKTAGKESIASEGEMKKYMKTCLSDLYKKVSAQIRKELRIKEAENRMKLYKHFIPFIIDAISDSIAVDKEKLSAAFTKLAEKQVKLNNTEEEISSINKDINIDIDTENKNKFSENKKDNKTIKTDNKDQQPPTEKLQEIVNIKNKKNKIGKKRSIINNNTKTKTKIQQITLDQFNNKSKRRRIQ